MKTIPIFFIHIGNQEYLHYAISSAEKYNRDVYLLGDKSNQRFCRNWFRLDDYKDEDTDTFVKNYVHMSCNAPVFDIQCIQRYIILRNFMRRHNMDCACMADSDLLFFENMSRAIQYKDKVYFSFQYDDKGTIVSSSAHCAYWPLKRLEQFCDFILKMYIEDIEVLKELYKRKMKIHYRAISDMDLLDLWANQNSQYLISTDKIRNHSVFDHNINTIAEYQRNCFGMKKLYRRGDKLYFKKNRKLVQVNTIHAQGNAKKYMKQFLKKRTSLFWYCIYNKLS